VRPGLLVVDKARGPTSHDVVGMVRRAMGTRHVGHAGTLDPMATGVLVLALGEATKLLTYLAFEAKSYEARIRLGQQTDTLDALGKVVAEQPPDEALVAALDRPDAAFAPRIAGAVAAELARTSQDPPVFSAIKQQGEPAYARARRGEAVDLPPRPVRVHELTVTATAGTPSPSLDLRVTADKGYYVRSLGRDLARGLGTVGHLVALRRVASGGFTVGEAVSLPCAREVLESRIVPLTVAARRALPSATLTDDGVTFARCGKRLAVERFDGDVPRAQPSAWFDRSGALVAVGIFEEDGRVLRGFVEEA
jgi:tRNA pseudouridine55 synthase